jgi:acetoacetate decarboxylase
MKRAVYLIAVIATIGLMGFFSTGHPAGPANGQGNMYEEFDGIMIFYTPKDTVTYRALLPKVFDLPDEPLVQAFVIDYYKMASWAIKPYQEAAIFLLAKYKGGEFWHCLTMPVTTDDARIGGIKYLGYPKVLAEVNFIREPPVFRGNLKANGKTILEVALDTNDHAVTGTETQWFRRLAGIPPLNFLNGKLVKPRPGGSKEVTMLDLSIKYPQVFQVKTGKARWAASPEAAPGDSDWRPSAFGIEVKEIVLAYYFQNKYGFSFGRPEEVAK